MSDRIKKIKVKKADGSMTDYIPIGVDAENVDFDNGYKLDNIVGSINPDESGSIAAQLSKSIKYYDCVADMKADTTLNGGGAARTLGYYEPGDGGGALYEIIDATDDRYSTSTDDGGSVHDLTNGNKALLNIEKDIIYIDTLGAKSLDENNLFNNSLILQKAINLCVQYNISKIIFGNKKYYFSSNFSINNANLKMTLEGTKNTTFVLSPSNNGNELNILTINSINSFEMYNITVVLLNNEELSWSDRLSWFASKSSSGDAQQITISNCRFEYTRYGFKIGQKNIVTTPVSSQGYTQNILIENTIFKKCRDCLHICNANTIIIKDCECSGLNTQEYADAGGTRRSIIFYVRPNIENLICDNLFIEDCTGDVFHYNQFDYGTSEPTPEDYPDYYVNHTLLNNIKMKNIGIFIGLNSYTKNISANNIQIDQTIGDLYTAVIHSFEGKFGNITINNFTFKDITNLLNLQSTSRGGELVSFSNGTIEHSNKRYNPSTGPLKKLVLDNIYFKRIYSKGSNSAAQCLVLNGAYDMVSLTNLTCDIDNTKMIAASDLFRFGADFQGSVFVDHIDMLDVEKATKVHDVTLFYFNNAIQDANIFALFNNINITNFIIFSNQSAFPSYNNVHFNNCYINKTLYSI